MGVAAELFFSGSTQPASVDALVIAGWTGRERAAVERHIEELAAIGVARPPCVPCFYRVGANLLTTGVSIKRAAPRGCSPPEI
jgi:hypothetical protein